MQIIFAPVAYFLKKKAEPLLNTAAQIYWAQLACLPREWLVNQNRKLEGGQCIYLWLSHRSAKSGILTAYFLDLIECMPGVNNINRPSFTLQAMGTQMFWLPNSKLVSVSCLDMEMRVE